MCLAELNNSLDFIVSLSIAEKRSKNILTLVTIGNWTSADQSRTKNPALTGFSGLLWMLLVLNLVEAAGVEPASASTLPLALHA